jgi:PelA/Pel-15E family pectate lyase
MNFTLLALKPQPFMARLSAVLALLALTWSAAAGKITVDRIEALPPAERSAWKAYWERSLTNASLDRFALQAEVTAAKLTNALRAPSGGDFRLSVSYPDPWYSSEEAARLADTILSYQTPSGGWSKHTGYSHGPRKPGMQWTSQNEPGRSFHYVATFDNHATTEEMLFLAHMWRATQREDCKAGFIRGLHFILNAQYPHGGWPQVYPLEGGYHDDITFNDDAMTRILALLLSITRDDTAPAFLDPALRQQASVALADGIRCVLNVQIVQDGRKTVWCAQYDPLSLQPTSARAMEPVALSGLESSRVLKFLMSITNPSPEIVASIEGGLAWYEKARITSLSKTERQGKTSYEANPASTEVYWARFYNLTNSAPMFPGRDGVIYDSFAAMAAKNEVGYDFLTTLPGSIVNNGQKKWRKMLSGK